MRVLHLTTYPVAVPRHGGQARVAHIVRAYERAGFASRALAVYHAEYYPRAHAGPHDVGVPAAGIAAYERWPLCTDVASGACAASDASVWDRVVEQVRTFAPDVIQLEQPWCWPIVERLRAERAVGSFRLVYSSQNVEAPLKARLLASHPDAVREAAVTAITALERIVVAAADLTVAVTSADADTYRGWGACRVVIAPNGIAERAVDPRRVRAWQERLDGLRFALFVGSSHPPNVSGFWEMFAPSLAFLAPDERIVVVGGIGGPLLDSPLCRPWEGINASRVERVGEQSEEDLAALLSLASCIVLPIRIGGGSNIKTAEAIVARRPVVGTSLSFRGYEPALELPGIFRADAPADFRRLVSRALDGTLPTGPPDRPGLRRAVLWSETLKTLPGAIGELAGAGSAASPPPPA